MGKVYSYFAFKIRKKIKYDKFIYMAHKRPIAGEFIELLDFKLNECNGILCCSCDMVHTIHGQMNLNNFIAWKYVED